MFFIFSKYKKLREKYDALEKKYIAEVADHLDLRYQYDTLLDDWRHSESQREEIERLHENTRRLKHDMRNHIMVIASHLNSGAVEEAKQYLSVVLDNLDRVYSYIQTGNAVMNYIVNSKLQYAQRKGIQFKAEIENLPFSRVGSVDFSALLGNALDNAIEASVGKKDAFIDVSVSKKRGYDTIAVKNRIEGSVLEANPELHSTKANGMTHGYGMKQIKSIAEKYGGLVDIYEEDDMFCVSIMIPSEE